MRLKAKIKLELNRFFFKELVKRLFNFHIFVLMNYSGNTAMMAKPWIN